MKLAFYPGCSLESSAKEYGDSTLLVARSLGIDLEEIPDWICCGSTPAHMSSKLLSVTLSAYNLIAARKIGAEAVVVSCASCYSRLKSANHEIRSDASVRAKVEKALGATYDGSIKVMHMLELVNKQIEEKGLEEKIRRRLKGLKVASYYGCLLVRPPEVMDFDDPEDPQMLDRLVEALGAEPVEWRYKVECCGAALAFSQSEIVLKLGGEILEDAKESGADLVLVACPLCHSNLDLRQRNIEKYTGLDLELPILYFTQLLGLALGYSAGKLGLGKHMISPIPVLKKRGIQA